MPTEPREARRAVEAVLRDQAERERRRKHPRNGTRRSTVYVMATAVLAAVSVSVWTSPPPWVRPDAVPRPAPERLEAGLRMDMWQTVQEIREFQASRGRLPVYLWEAVDEPSPATELSYDRLTPEIFRLVGRRGALELRYESDEPLEGFIAPGISVIRSEGP